MIRSFFFGYDRPTPGRELAGMETIANVTTFLEKQKAAGNINSFDLVSLTPHGGDLNGFILVRGEQSKLDALRSSDEFVDLLYHAHLHLQKFGVADGLTGERVKRQMGRAANLFVRNNGMDVIK